MSVSNISYASKKVGLIQTIFSAVLENVVILNGTK